VGVNLVVIKEATFGLFKRPVPSITQLKQLAGIPTLLSTGPEIYKCTIGAINPIRALLIKIASNTEFGNPKYAPSTNYVINAVLS
jgi:hypothetical protein